jgi:hypothetical protein
MPACRAVGHPPAARAVTAFAQHAQVPRGGGVGGTLEPALELLERQPRRGRLAGP